MFVKVIEIKHVASEDQRIEFPFYYMNYKKKLFNKCIHNDCLVQLLVQ